MHGTQSQPTCYGRRGMGWVPLLLIRPLLQRRFVLGDNQRKNPFRVEHSKQCELLSTQQHIPQNSPLRIWISNKWASGESSWVRSYSHSVLRYSCALIQQDSERTIGIGSVESGPLQPKLLVAAQTQMKNKTRLLFGKILAFSLMILHIDKSVFVILCTLPFSVARTELQTIILSLRLYSDSKFAWVSGCTLTASLNARLSNFLFLEPCGMPVHILHLCVKNAHGSAQCTKYQPANWLIPSGVSRHSK